MGEASLAAGDVDGGVDESTLEPEGAASSESPLGRSGAPLSALCLCPQGSPGGGGAGGLVGKVERSLPQRASLPFLAPRAGRTRLPDVAEDGSTIPTFTT